MAELKERLRTALSTALRARDQLRLRTLRSALTAITNEEVSGKAARELSDDEVLKVLAREARKRREAADAFGAAGREDQAATERAEGEVLASYLPAQLSDDELSDEELTDEELTDEELTDEELTDEELTALALAAASSSLTS